MLIMWIGILQYVRDNLGLSRCALIALAPAVLLAPVAVPLLDVLWLVLKVPPAGDALQRRSPTRFANFMITYGAARTLVETFLESLPQLAIQIYLARSSPDDLRLLALSIALSFLDFVWVLVNNVYTAKKNGRSFARHLDLLRRVGGGAFENGLSAIVGNSAESVDLSNLDLNVDQARQVAHALGGNRSLTALDVSGNDMGDGGKSAIGDALLSSSTSKLKATDRYASRRPPDSARANPPPTRSRTRDELTRCTSPDSTPNNRCVRARHPGWYTHARTPSEEHTRQWSP